MPAGRFQGVTCWRSGSNDDNGSDIMTGLKPETRAKQAFEMTAFEDFVTEEVRKGRGIFGLYPATDDKALADFAAWRKAAKR